MATTLRPITFAVCLIINACSTASAQLAYDNAFSFGNTGFDAGYGISTQTSTGNYYCGGSYSFWMDMDPGGASTIITSNGGVDGYVAKYDAAHAVQWAFTIGGTGDDYIYSVKNDGNGNVFITGRFTGTVDFDPSAGNNIFTSNGGFDIFIAKYNANGGYLWAYTYGGADDDKGNKLVYDAVNNNILVTGAFESTSMDLDPNPNVVTVTNQSNPGLGYADAFVASYSAANGLLNWAFGIGGDRGDNGGNVTVDTNGNVFVTGQFSDLNVDFDPSAASQPLTSAGSVDVYIAKYNSAGAYQWAYRLGNTGGDIGYAIACDNNGFVYTGGYFNSDSIDADPGVAEHYLYTNGVQDLFVVKLDNNGQYQWAFSAGDFYTESVQDIAVDGSGSIFITGNFGGTVDFDPGPGVYAPIGNANTDGYLAQYDANGNFISVVPYVGAGFEFGLGLTIMGGNKVGVTGYFSSATVDFDQTGVSHDLTNTGTSISFSDVFVATYNYTTTGITENAANTLSCSLSPNPVQNELTVRSSEKMDALIITDITGKVIYTARPETETLKIVLSDFYSGMYILQATSGIATFRKKVVVQH